MNHNTMQNKDVDAYVVGSGPNGLAAAITLARAGLAVRVLERNETIGGGMRTEELTLPGYWHDVCSAVHPMTAASPFFRSLPLESFGLEWIHPSAPLAHPLDDGTAVMLERSLEATARGLGVDERAYYRLLKPWVSAWDKLMHDFLGPLRFPRYPLLFLRFGLLALLPATLLARFAFRGERARALFGGLASHAILPLSSPLTGGFGLMFGVLGHSVGWPSPRGGSRSLAAAMCKYLESLGGQILTNSPVNSVGELPESQAALLDVTPRQILTMAGNRLPKLYRWQLEHYRYGPGVFKVDWALDGPIPWKAQECARAGTVHIGGTLAEVTAEERSLWQGNIPDHPFVLLAQPSNFDPTRAPEGKQTIWGYCHVPNGSDVDMTDRIEAQIERFAPGFRNRILARSTLSPAQLQAHDPNDIGGDITGGVADLRQFYTRPAIRLDPYRIPLGKLYICSASTPPGGGVHGMCGYFGARSALRRIVR